jgi:hypothetical protein
MANITEFILVPNLQVKGQGTSPNALNLLLSPSKIYDLQTA